MSEGMTLWRTEKGVVEVARNTLAVSVRLDDRIDGYVFHGKGKLLLDAIVETEEGALGKSVERELSDPFLMLGEADGIEELLTATSPEDFSAIGHENQREFMKEAEDLCNRFLRDSMHSRRHFNLEDGVFFAFQDEGDKLGILVASGSKLVYNAEAVAFVSSGDNVVLNMAGEVVCNSRGKCVIVSRTSNHCCR